MFTAVSRQFSFLGWIRYWLFDRNYSMTLRVFLIGICFGFTALSAILGRDIDFNSFPSIAKALFLIVVIFGVTLAIFMYRNMESTALGIFILSTLVNEGINTGTGTKLTFTFLALTLWSVVWVFRMVIVDRKFDVRRSLTNWPVVLFIAAVFISFVWSAVFVEESASYIFAQKLLVRVMTAITLMISPLTLVLFANAFRTRKAFRVFTNWFIVIGIVMAVMRLAFGSIAAPLNGRGQFPTWFAAITLGQVLFNKNLPRPLKIILLIGLGAWAYITLGLGLGWLSGWLPMILVILTLVTFYSRKLLLLILLGGVVWGIFNTSFLDKTFGAEQDESGHTRSVAWARSLGVASQHALFGAGPAGYQFYFVAYGYYNGPVGTTDLSHNNYIDIIAQTGVVGFTLWVMMWGAQGWMIWKLFRKKIDDPFMNGLRYSLIACYPAILVAMMLGDWITPFPYTQTLAGIDYTIWAWMISGITIALYYFTPNSQDMAKQPSLFSPLELSHAD